MPFKSEKQRRYLHMHEPTIADRWEREAKRKGTKAVQPKAKDKKGR